MKALTKLLHFPVSTLKSTFTYVHKVTYMKMFVVTLFVIQNLRNNLNIFK